MNNICVIKNSEPCEIVEIPFDSEAEFESFLEAQPSTIPAKEIDPAIQAILPIGRQVTVGSYSIDLLFLADTGHLLVLECKLIENPECRREVVSQLLEYYLRIKTGWTATHVMSIAEEYLSDATTESNKHQTLLDRLNEGLRKNKSDQPVPTQAILEKRIKRHIESPILVIAGNRVDQRALVLSDFLRTLKVPIACIDVRRYGIGAAEIATGQVRAASLLSTTSASQRESITEEEWLSIDHDETLKVVREDFLDWAKSLAREGIIGVRIGSTELMIDATKGGKTKNLLSLSTRLYINFATLRSFGFSEDAVSGYRGKIAAVVGPHVLGSGSSWPSIPLVNLANDRVRSDLKVVLERLIRFLAANRSTTVLNSNQ